MRGSRAVGQHAHADAQREAYLGDVAKFVAANSAHPVLGSEVKRLGLAQEALAGSAMHFLIALVLVFTVLAFAGDWFSPPTATTTVQDVSRKSPAAEALVHPGD